jgi:hypothetical protein
MATKAELDSFFQQNPPLPAPYDQFMVPGDGPFAGQLLRVILQQVGPYDIYPYDPSLPELRRILRTIPDEDCRNFARALRPDTPADTHELAITSVCGWRG